MNTRLASMAAVLGALLVVSGCANRAIATLSPGADLSRAKSFYVVKLPADKRGVDKLISDRLMQMGYTAKSGPELSPPYTTDVVVTYEDKWVWDITMYMLELTVVFRSPDTNYPMASGNSMHTSLTRKSAEEMVEEVLTSIFAKVKPGS